MSARTRRRLRYASPVVLAGVVGLAASLPSMSAGATTPALPDITAQQLILKVEQAQLTALQGSVTLTPNLGLPLLSGLTTAGGQEGSGAAAFDPTTLLTGSHTIEVWTDGTRQRLALPTPSAETDVVRNGNEAWVYDSATQHVDHYVVVAPAGQAPGPMGATPDPTSAATTPEQTAAKLIAAITPSTQVDVVAGPDVAGQHVYLLTLAPKAGTPQAAQSTLERVAISVDAANGLPLQVVVYAKSSPTPVFTLGYTTVSFSTPSASNFTAPIGTSTTTKYLHPHAGMHPGSVHADPGMHPDSSMNPGYGMGAPGAATAAGGTTGQPSVTGNPWAQVVSFSNARIAGLPQLQSVTTAVSGSFGTARLLQTNLVNALILPSGRVLVGFVTPAVLEAAAGTAG